jgi:6-methylsalicylate decarboxylase
MTEPGRGWARGCACCARPQDATRVSRRRFLAEGIAAGTALGLGVSAADAQSDNPRRIDVHHHLAPPSSRAAALDRRRGDSG